MKKVSLRALDKSSESIQAMIKAAVQDEMRAQAQVMPAMLANEIGNLMAHGESKGDENWDLTQKDKSILSLIKENPGISKQKVVDFLKGTYSRVTVFNTITKLLEYGLIVATADPGNRHAYNLSSNEKSFIGTLQNDLDTFQESFLTLLEKLSGGMRKQAGAENTSSFVRNLIILYRHTFDIYLLYMLTRGPYAAGKIELAKSHMILFSKMAKVLEGLSDANQKYTGGQVFSREQMSLRREYSFLPELKLIEESRIMAKSLNLLHELEALLNTILKVSFNTIAMIYLGSSTDDVPIKNSNGLRFYDEFCQTAKDRRFDDKQILKILERHN